MASEVDYFFFKSLQFILNPKKGGGHIVPPLARLRDFLTKTLL